MKYGFAQGLKIIKKKNNKKKSLTHERRDPDWTHIIIISDTAIETSGILLTVLFLDHLKGQLLRGIKTQSPITVRHVVTSRETQQAAKDELSLK